MLRILQEKNWAPLLFTNFRALYLFSGCVSLGVSDFVLKQHNKTSIFNGNVKEWLMPKNFVWVFWTPWEYPEVSEQFPFCFESDFNRGVFSTQKLELSCFYYPADCFKNFLHLHTHIQSSWFMERDSFIQRSPFNLKHQFPKSKFSVKTNNASHINRVLGLLLKW